MRKYYVYMLRCFDGTFYIGMTNNIDRRLYEHHEGLDAPCYTSIRRPLRLVFVADFPRPRDAIAFEKQMKGWTHIKKRAYAEQNWPLVSQLAKGRSRKR